MDKLFIHILDVIKYLEVKAQEKPQRKKYWVLGNQYIQPVDDVLEEEKCSGYDLKRKAQCVYQAARSGMKEGMLAGVFLGGFYGLIKNLNENVTNALIPSSENEVNCREEEKDPTVRDKSVMASETDDAKGVHMGNSNQQSQTDSGDQTFIRESALKNKKRGKSTFTKSETPDRGSSNDFKTERRASSAGQSGNENLVPVEKVRPNTVMTVGNNKSNPRERDKVEIVGYAFVHALDANNSETSGGTDSDDSDERKEPPRKEKDGSGSPNKYEPKSRENSMQDPSGSSVSNYTKNVLGSIREGQRKKKDGEERKTEAVQSMSSDTSQETYPAQIFLETKTKPSAGDKANENDDLVTLSDMWKKKEDRTVEAESLKDVKSGSSTITVESKYKPVWDKGKACANKGGKKKFSKGNRFSVDTTESRDSKSDSKRGIKRNKSKIRVFKFEKGGATSKHRKSDGSKSKTGIGYYGGNFISRKISKSILVDADLISNGYSLSLNTESSNSLDDFQPLFESSYPLDTSTQKFHQIMGHSRTTIKESDSVSYTSKKRLVFGKPEFFQLSEVPSTPSPTRTQEDSGNIDAVDSTGSDVESGQNSQILRSDYLHEPPSVQSVASLKGTSGDIHPESSHIVKVPSKSGVVGASTVLNGHTSPKAVSIGDSAATSFVQIGVSSNRQSREVHHHTPSDTEIVRNEITTEKVRSVREGIVPCPPRNSYFLLKNVSDSLILLSACNCAVVLGLLCCVVSTTKASLSF